MSKEIVYSGQNFFNKVIECTGDVDNAFAMMVLNNKKTFTEAIQVGSALKKSGITDYDVVEFFTENKRPATVLQRIETAIDYRFPMEFPISF